MEIGTRYKNIFAHKKNNSQCQCRQKVKIIFLEIKVKENKLIGSIPSWGPIFKINFDLKVLSFATCSPDGVANYLTFTASDNDCCKTEFLHFFNNFGGGFLQLATQINENGNLVKNSPQLEENVWYKVEVEQLMDNKQVIKKKIR